MHYDTVMNDYIRPVYAEQKAEVDRLKNLLKMKEAQVSRIETRMEKPKANPLNEIAQ